MSEVTAMLSALRILLPLIEQLAKYLVNGGDLPEFMTTLPRPLKSELALAARKAMGE